MVNILRACEDCGLWFATKSHVCPPEVLPSYGQGRHGGQLHSYLYNDISQLLEGDEVKCPACRGKVLEKQ